MQKHNHLTEARQIIRNGGVVIFPTDTAYGIGCRIDVPDAVDKLFTIRRRPKTQAVPVLVDSIDMAIQYFSKPPAVAVRLMHAFWPGALTVIADCRTAAVYGPIRGGGGTVGLRMPDHPVALALISACGVPVIGTSANFHGAKTPYAQDQLDPELCRLADLVVPGNITLGEVSTVINCSITPPQILRQGAVRISESELYGA